MARVLISETVLICCYHGHDFSLDAAWVLTATGHGKRASDGIGTILKSAARCAILTNKICLSNLHDFYEFCNCIDSSITNDLYTRKLNC